MTETNQEPAALLLLEFVQRFTPACWDFIRVELTRSRIDKLLAQMEDVGELNDRYSGMDDVSFMDRSLTVFRHPGPSSDPAFPHRPFRKALEEVSPDWGEERVRLPANLPRPELDVQRVSVRERAVDNNGDKIHWKLLDDVDDPWLHSRPVYRDELERIRRKLACYEMGGETQLQELEAIAEDDDDLFEEILDDGRKMLLTRATTDGQLPIDWLLKQVEIDRKEVLRLIESDDRQVRRNGIILSRHLEMGVEDLHEVAEPEQEPSEHSRR